jgi:hypothetical protein
MASINSSTPGRSPSPALREGKPNGSRRSPRPASGAEPVVASTPEVAPSRRPAAPPLAPTPQAASVHGGVRTRPHSPAPSLSERRCPESAPPITAAPPAPAVPKSAAPAPQAKAASALAYLKLAWKKHRTHVITTLLAAAAVATILGFGAAIVASGVMSGGGLFLVILATLLLPGGLGGTALYFSVKSLIKSLVQERQQEQEQRALDPG